MTRPAPADPRAAALLEAAARLADTLAEENAALRALDIPRATRLVDAKSAALAALQHLLMAQAGAPASPEDDMRRTAENLSQRLYSELEKNRRLLERAITVQERIIGMIARALPRAIAANAPRYGAKGGLQTQHLQRPIALSSRA